MIILQVYVIIVISIMIVLQVLLHGVVALTLYWVIQYRWQVY